VKDANDRADLTWPRHAILFDMGLPDDFMTAPSTPPGTTPRRGDAPGQALSGSPEFDRLKQAFTNDPGLRQETEWAYRLAVETYNPSDRGLRFITGAIGEWIITLAAYRAGLVTLPDGHGADGHDTIDVLGGARALWSVKTSYKPGGNFTITNGLGGPGAGLVVPTVFLSPDLPGVVFVHPHEHAEVVERVEFGKDSSKLSKTHLMAHANRHPECVIELAMPINPGAAVRDPALEAVKLLVDTVNFPRLRAMFAEIASRGDSSLVTQIRDLKRLLEDGTLDEPQYRAAVDRLTRGGS
jgi:hypothetical protein